jgi:fucose 4-O-acetylase-like acetyltransferase
MNTQNRDNAIDIAKGIGILLVIVGHTGGLPADTYIHHFIYSFHMPLFFILGGFLFKPSNIGTHIRKDAKRLLLPYVFSVFLLTLWFVILGIKYDNYGMVWRTLQTGWFGSGQYHASPIWGDYPTIGMIWFLLAMFWCRVTYNMIAKLPKLHKYLLGAVVAMAATMIDNFIINLPLGILTGLSAIVFYMLGNALNENLAWVHKKHTIF